MIVGNQITIKLERHSSNHGWTVSNDSIRDNRLSFVDLLEIFCQVNMSLAFLLRAGEKYFKKTKKQKKVLDT